MFYLYRIILVLTYCNRVLNYEYLWLRCKTRCLNIGYKFRIYRSWITFKSLWLNLLLLYIVLFDVPPTVCGCDHSTLIYYLERQYHHVRRTCFPQYYSRYLLCMCLSLNKYGHMFKFVCILVCLNLADALRSRFVHFCAIPLTDSLDAIRAVARFLLVGGPSGAI